MIPSQVNRVSALVALVLSLSCAPAGTARQGAESTTVTRADTTSVTARPAQTDSIITRADLARIQGSASAPLWVIEVSDFQCPYCKQWHDQTYNAFLDQYVKTGKVRLAYVNFPLASHQYAWPAAESAMCAGAQGKFWPMHDALFATQARWEATSTPMVVFDSLAQANGLDMQRWRDCVTSGKMKPLIEADHDRAARAGASATPSFMIGDKILTGAQPLPELQRVIDSALVKTKKATP
ncbi:MAG TPA: DsbA family protein [Gemmatimonadaceae bacterium]|jgi:protein-disulfide isomerase